MEALSFFIWIWYVNWHFLVDMRSCCSTLWVEMTIFELQLVASGFNVWPLKSQKYVWQGLQISVFMQAEIRKQFFMSVSCCFSIFFQCLWLTVYLLVKLKLLQNCLCIQCLYMYTEVALFMPFLPISLTVLWSHIVPTSLFMFVYALHPVPCVV